jgi:ketosteroid isomerase-like protein
MDTLYSDPGEVVAQYRSEMRMADPNLRYGNEYISRFTIRDGRIIRFVDGFDSVRLVLGFGGTVEAPRIA